MPKSIFKYLIKQCDSKETLKAAADSQHFSKLAHSFKSLNMDLNILFQAFKFETIGLAVTCISTLVYESLLDGTLPLGWGALPIGSLTLAPSAIPIGTLTLGQRVLL